MVIGYGPPLRCDSAPLVPQSNVDTVGQSLLNDPLTFLTSTSRADLFAIADPEETHSVSVPYVADLPGIQRGTTRPFYCSIFPDSIQPNPNAGRNSFQQDRWVFYHVPREIKVPYNRLYEY